MSAPRVVRSRGAARTPPRGRRECGVGRAGLEALCAWSSPDVGQGERIDVLSAKLQRDQKNVHRTVPEDLAQLAAQVDQGGLLPDVIEGFVAVEIPALHDCWIDFEPDAIEGVVIGVEDDRDLVGVSCPFPSSNWSRRANTDVLRWSVLTLMKSGAPAMQSLAVLLLHPACDSAVT